MTLPDDPDYFEKARAKSCYGIPLEVRDRLTIGLTMDQHMWLMSHTGPFGGHVRDADELVRIVRDLRRFFEERGL